MKQSDILFLLASSFVVVCAWIGFNLYHKWATSTISPELQTQIIPIAPTFDQETIDKIKTRKTVAPVYDIKNTEASPTPEPQITPTESPIINSTSPETP